jgi:hypothetical protein
MVRLAQTVHLYCTKISTISKQTKMSFHLTLVTWEYHRVCPKWFMSLWYVWQKPCPYLAPTLIVSPNRPKRDSTWPTSPRSSIGCVQNDFWAYGRFGTNHAPILHGNWHCLQMDRHEITYDPHHLEVPSGASKMISEPMVCLAQTVHLPCDKIATISKWTETSFHLSLIT